MFRKGHSYNVAGAKTDPRGFRGGSGPEVTGTFKRNDSIAQRGGLRAVKRMSEKGEKQHFASGPSIRRGSDGSLGKNALSIFNEVHSRRSSTPNISLDMAQTKQLDNDELIEKQKKRQSTYMELLEEVVTELNLKDLKNDNNQTHTCSCVKHEECACVDVHNEEEFIKIAFEFLDNLENDLPQVLISRNIK